MSKWFANSILSELAGCQDICATASNAEPQNLDAKDQFHIFICHRASDFN
jgi:hypothetical protein